MIRFIKSTLRIMLTGAFLFYFQLAGAQFYITGNVPWFQKYESIQTRHFEVIYPQHFQRGALKYARLLDSIASLTETNIKSARPFPVILNSTSTLSNGFVAWAPKRMEVVTSPMQNTLSQPWYSLLVLHEFKHVMQLNTLNSNFTRFLSYPLGQSAVGITAGIAPLWFYEGDAVVFETEMSDAGRGRSADFLKNYYVNEANGIRFSYDKAYFGSYKHHVPDYYQMGYFLVNHANMFYGRQVWPNVLNHISKYPFLITPFYFGLKKETGLTKVQFYNSAMDSLKQQVAPQNIDGQKADKNYMEQHAPVADASGNIYYIQRSPGDFPRIVKKTAGKVKIFHTPGTITSNRLAISDKYLAWQEYQVDARWEKRSYQVIRLKNLNTGKTFSLKKHARHYSPAFSADNKILALVNLAHNNSFNIELYNTQNFTLIKTLFPPYNFHLSYPTFLPDGSIVVLGLDRNGKSVWKVNTHTNNWQQLTTPVKHQVSHLQAYNNVVYYHSDKHGAMNVFALNLTTKTEKQITFDNYGAYYPLVVNDSVLLTARYDIDGYTLSKEKIKVGATQNQQVKINWLKEGALPEKIDLETTGITKSDKYQPKPYKKHRHLFQIHSWLPFYADVDALSQMDFESAPIYPGFSLFTQNHLETVYGQLSYYYANNRHYIEPKLTFAGLYPVIELEMNFLGESFGNLGKQLQYHPLHHKGNYRFNAKVYVPLRYNINNVNFSLQPMVGYTRESLAFYTDQLNKLPNSIKFVTADWKSLLATKQAHRDLLPRWGWYTNLAAGTTVLAPGGPRFFMANRFYAPGLFRHHSINVYAAYQNIFWKGAYPRSLGSSFIDTEQYYLTQFNYLLPLAYPEWSLGPLAYLKRLSVNVFYDAVFFQYNDDPLEKRRYQNSIGGELWWDAHFMRFIAPFTIKSVFGYDIKRQQYDVGFSTAVSF